MSKSIEARLRRLEAAIGPPEPGDPWEGSDPIIRQTVSHHAISVALDVGDAGGDTRAAQLAAIEAIESRFAAEGLMDRPLDDAQRARVGAIFAEMTDAPAG